MLFMKAVFVEYIISKKSSDITERRRAFKVKADGSLLLLSDMGPHVSHLARSCHNGSSNEE